MFFRSNSYVLYVCVLLKNVPSVNSQWAYLQQPNLSLNFFIFPFPLCSFGSRPKWEQGIPNSGADEQWELNRNLYRHEGCCSVLCQTCIEFTHECRYHSCKAIFKQWNAMKNGHAIYPKVWITAALVIFSKSVKTCKITEMAL